MFLEKRDTDELTEKPDAQKYTKNLQMLSIYENQTTYLGAEVMH